MNKVKIGVQAMMLKTKFEEIGAYDTLKQISEIGFHCIELSQIEMNEKNVLEIKRACDDFDIEIAAMSASLTGNPGMKMENLSDDYDKIVQDCRTLNCNFLRVGMLPFQCMGSFEKVLEFCKDINEMAKRLKGDQIKLYYHNHHIEFQKYDGKYLLDIIRENANEIGFEIDVHWVQRGGLNPVSVLKDYQGLVDLVHLKDYRIGRLPQEAFASLAKGDFMKFMDAFNNVVEFSEIGEGNLDFKSIITQGLASGAKYFLIEQDNTYGLDPFDSLKISYDNLVSMGYSEMF